MSFIGNQGIEPTIQLDSVGIGLQLGADGNAINVDGLDLNRNEYLVVGEKTYYPEEDNQRNTKWSLLVNSDGVAVNTSRNSSSNFLNSDTSFFVDKNFYCAGIVKAAGLELNDIILDGDPLTSSLIRDFIINANNISANQPFQAGLNTSYDDVYNYNYFVKNVFTPNFVTLGGHVDTYDNTHPLNIVSTANNKFNSMHIAIRNDTNNEEEPTKFGFGIIGGSNISPAIISTTRGTPLEFHISKSSSNIDELYGTSAIPIYTNINQYPALAIDENNNIAIGINKTSPKDYTRKVLNNGEITSEDIIDENIKLQVNGVSCFNEIIMYDYYTNTHKALDDIYVRSTGISVINSAQISEGDFLGNLYNFNNITVNDLLKTSNLTIDNDINVNNNIQTSSLIVDNVANFSGIVQFDNEVNFNNAQSVSINKLKINDDIYIGNRKIIPIDIDDPATGYGTYSRSEDGSNYFFVYVHSNIATLDANCNISFPKKMAIGLTDSDGFDGVLNIIKDDVTTSNNFDITMKNTVEGKEYYANIGRLSRLDYSDNSLIFNTNKVIGKNNNIYFYPSTDMADITSNYYLPNIRSVPPTLSLNRERVGINKLGARVGYELDVEGKVAARDYYLTIGNEMQRTKGFIYQPKNFFNIYDSQTDKFCINYNNLTSYATNMKGLNVKRGINSDYYYQNDKIIETLQIANDTNGFYTNKKISLGWNGEDVSVPLQLRNLTTEDNNYSVLRIYRGVKGGGANNNADYSGIDICEYDRNLNTDRNAERWFIYKNHTFNDIDSRNIQRVGPLQIGYIDKDVKPKTYGMSFYYNTENSNYHIDVNKDTVSYEDNNAAMSIYGDLDVHGNINIIDKYGSNYNFRLDNLNTLTQITQYITTVETTQYNDAALDDESDLPSVNNDIRYTGYNILYTPTKSVIVDPIEKTNIPIIVKQDNSNLAVAKFITYSDYTSNNCSSFIELAIYNCNLMIADDNYEKTGNIKNMIKFNLSSDDDKHTNFDMSFYHQDYYKKFYNFKNNIDESGNFLGSSTHIGIGNNIDNNSNVAFHIDDINKYGLQLTNNHHAPAINLLYTGGSSNIYHTLSGASFENNYRFSIDVANKSVFNEPESSNVFTIDAFDGNNLRKGARFGFNDDILAESFVIKTDYDTPAMAITSRYTSEYVFDSVVDIFPDNLLLSRLASEWNNTSKEYSVTYNYGVSYFPDIDNNLNPISYINKLDPNFLFKTSVSQSSNINYKTFHSNLDIFYNASNLNIDFNNYKTSTLNVTNYDITNNITTCTLDFTTELFTCNILLVPQLSFTDNTITIDDSKSSVIIIEDSFSSNISLIDNVTSNYDFTYNYSNVVFLPEYLNCNITYFSHFNSNIVDDSNMIYINNEIYIDILPFDSDDIFYQYMNAEVETRSLIDNGIYTSIFLETTTSNIVRINSNIDLTGKFTAERHNTILFKSSNILPNSFVNLEAEDNHFDYDYNIQIEDDSSNIYIISSNFVVNNNVNSLPRDMELINVNSNYLFEDHFNIYGNDITNKIYLNEYFNKLSNNQDRNYVINVKNYNYKNFKPHITLSNEIDTLNKKDGHEIYSYDGIFEIKYVNGNDNDNRTPLRIDADGNTFIRGDIDMGGNIRFDGKIYDSNGNDLIQILNSNHYKEYEINSSNIHFNSLGSNGVEIRSYSSSNYDDFKFFYAQDYLDYGMVNDVMILHKRFDEETQYKIDMYGDIDTSNGILRVEGRDVIRDSCNYILHSSNVISNRISELETDFISEEAHSSNRFIVDHNYDYNMSINGDLVVYSNVIIYSNLTVLGEFTTLNTEVYTTEQVDITNHGNDIALKIKQTEDYKIVGIFDDSSEVFTIAYSGNVGIHSDNPILSLDINTTDAIHLPRGNVLERPTRDKTGADLTSLQGIIRFNNEYGQFEGFGSNNQWGVLGGVRDADRDTYIIAEQEAGSDDDYLLFVTAGSEKMVIKDDGRIGIGMSAPTYYLDVVGDIRAASNLYIGSNFGINNETPFVTMDVNTTDSIKIPKGDSSQRPVDNYETDETHRGYIRFNTQLEQFEGYGEGNKWGVLGGVRDTDRDTYIIAEDYAGDDNDELKLVTAGSERMIVKADGKIGIGMSAPTYYLDVVGDIRAASNLYIGSNFGINNETPFVTMDVNTTDSIKIPKGDSSQRPVDNYETDETHRGYIRYNTELHQFEGYGSNNKWGVLGGVRDTDRDTYIIAEDYAGGDNDELKLVTAGSERMIVKADGKIGIGMSAPTYYLDVVGDIRAASNLYIGSNFGINNETPFVAMDINTTDSIKIPRGNIEQRPVSGEEQDTDLSIHKGYIRYNTDLEQFEGFGAGNKWGSLGGIKDVDGDTYISAENSAGDDNDELKFFTSNLERMVISSNGLIGIGTKHPNYVIDVVGGVNIITEGNEDYIYTIDGRDIIQESRDYTTATSNVISNRISDLETDFISEEAHSSNRFIVDHTYNFDLFVNGDLTASNLTIHGTTTTLNTDIYVTEQLDVQNSGAGIALNVLQHDNTGVAFNIQQNDTTYNILNISNSSDQVFTITNDGSVGIGVTNPNNNGNLLDVKGNINIITDGEDYIYTIDGRDIIQESRDYTTATSNVISNRISDLETDFISEEAHSSNRFIVDHKYDNDLLLNGTLTINSNLILFGDTDVALKITQNGDQDIVNIYNDTDEIFTILQSGFVGINTENPLVSLEINTTDSIKIPVGTSDERPTVNLAEGTNLSLHRGYIRFNTDLEQFEGFGASNTWGSLGGIKDIDGDTYVTAENSAGEDNDELKFFTSNLERMVISSNGLIGIGTTVPEYTFDIVGEIRGSCNLYISDKIGIGTLEPLVTLDINTVDGIILPKGNSSERPTNYLDISDVNTSNYIGTIRYNSELKQFEGFGTGNTWGSLGGIKDVDGDTYVTAESSPGEDNDELKFFTSNLERMVISSNGLVGIGTTSPDKNLTIYSENASFSIQDARNGTESVSSIELVNGSNNDFDKNELNYGWKISSSNDLFNITCGSNSAINDRFIIDGKTGNIGIGTKPHIYDSLQHEDEFKVNIVGSLNIEGDIYRDGTLFFGGGGGTGGGSMGVVSQNMTVQTMTETYSGTRVMSENDAQNGDADNGWRFIDNDLDSGFVIKIKPTHRKSKVLLNLSSHIGFDSTLDSRWWGLKLYRKRDGENWIEVKSANGNYNSTTEDNGDPALIGGSTACWLSHNLGANLSTYENFVANVSGSFCDSPDTRKDVYYTVKWKSRLGDTTDLSGDGDLYLNRPAKYNAAFTPVLSSSWVAQELWQLGTPYIPANGSNIITLYNQDYVGIGNTEPVYELDLIGNFRSAGDIFVDGKIGVNTYSPAFSLDINATDGLKLPAGDEAQRPDSSTIVKGVIRYNTESEQFEGYGAGNAWGSLGGVKDVDGDTYISAENNAGDDNDELKFYTSSNVSMVITSNGLIGIGTESPAFSLDINATDGLKLPTGDEAQRPDSSTIVKGVIRYNTYSDQFEGYGAGNAWGSLGGVKDVDGDTYISAENNAGDDNDELKFYTSSNERMVITSNGLIGIGNTEPNYKIDVDGEINASAFNINGTPFRLEFPSGMTLQSKHLTFTDTCTKSDTEVDWVPVNNDLTSGFVIRVKPTHSSSKILLNLICHIGMDYLHDSRWWGLKLYRKIGTGNWNEITGANGTGSNNGSACWISHNLGAESSTYSHSITNVTGSYEDEPQTTEDVYYTIYWKSRLDGTNGRLYLNKSAESIDTNYPKPSSSWSASEIWNNGVPYVPPPASSVISISDNNVGMGIVPTIDSVYKLNVNGNIKCHNLFQTSDRRYKQNILPLESALQMIGGINPVSYTTCEESKRKYGFIAQDLEDIIPDIVNIPRDSKDLYSIDYISMIPLLTKSIQELSNIINNQQKELNWLKTKL